MPCGTSCTRRAANTRRWGRWWTLEPSRAPADPAAWPEANRRWLVAALAVLRCHLERRAGEPLDAARRALAAAEAEMPAPPALLSLAERAGLSSFERDVLLLCAGVELDGAFAACCAAAQGDPRCTQPTFSLAMAVLPGAHWSALGPAAPLRRLGLVELGAGDALTRSPLRVAERALHHLVGVDQPDERLAAALDPVPPPEALAGSHRPLAERIAAALQRAGEAEPLPLIELLGDDRDAKLDIAAAACASLGVRLDRLSLPALLAGADELGLARLIEREALLGGGALLMDAEDLDERADAARWAALRRLVERVPGPLLVAARAPLRPARRPSIALEVRRPAVWDGRRAEAGPALDDLAMRVEARASWDDLVLPDPQREALRDLAAQVRHRAQVYEAWGFGRGAARGLGVSALFAGPSGTGKTLAAEVLAAELRLDLYRVDLSQVVSKYIGETEKNLRRVFDAAERGAAILLFDEADALFGRRSEVRDSHDRYANLDVAYLLQRMETYRGLSILTTNLRAALDPAFSRRLRAVVDFPFPAAAQRAVIWRKVFAPGVPLAGVSFERLARLRLAGGSIRNVALGAAFLAADAGVPIGMAHLLKAARAEYAKLERPLPEALLGEGALGEAGEEEEGTCPGS